MRVLTAPEAVGHAAVHPGIPQDSLCKHRHMLRYTWHSLIHSDPAALTPTSGPFFSCASSLPKQCLDLNFQNSLSAESSLLDSCSSQGPSGPGSSQLENRALPFHSESLLQAVCGCSVKELGKQSFRTPAHPFGRSLSGKPGLGSAGSLNSWCSQKHLAISLWVSCRRTQTGICTYPLLYCAPVCTLLLACSGQFSMSSPWFRWDETSEY